MGFMSKIKAGALATAVVAGATFAAGSASAAVVITLSNGGTVPIVGDAGGFETTFKNTGSSTASTTFSNTYSFVISPSKLGSASVTASFVTGGADINFSKVYFDSDIPADQFTKLSGGNKTTEFWLINDFLLTGANHTITFEGSLSGLKAGKDIKYNGNLALAAVPEPSTWAMLLVGFGLVGAGVRSRKRATVLA